MYDKVVLRKDAVWSDGKPIIAQDWLTGLQAVGKSQKTVRKSSFQDIQGFLDYCVGSASSGCKGTAKTITGTVVTPEGKIS